MNSRHPAADLWAFWISDAYAGPGALAAARSRLTSSRFPALFLDGFWREKNLVQLAGAVEQLPWERLLVVRNGAEVLPVDEAAFQACPRAERFSAHDRAVDVQAALDDTEPSDGPAQGALRGFFAFAVLTPGLSSWVSELLDCGPLRVLSLELSRYRPGDFIARHSDAVGTRAVNLVTYLDGAPAEPGAGSLHVTGPGGSGVIPPLRNRIVVLPIAAENSHWVSPWSGPAGRHTISLSFGPA